MWHRVAVIMPAMASRPVAHTPSPTLHAPSHPLAVGGAEVVAPAADHVRLVHRSQQQGARGVCVPQAAQEALCGQQLWSDVQQL